jgi:hypothetical protein
MNMKLSAPKVITWWIAVALGVLGLLGHFGTIAVLGQYAFWLAAAAFVLLALATFMKNL